jgi:hypothetical protein
MPSNEKLPKQVINPKKSNGLVDAGSGGGGSSSGVVMQRKMHGSGVFQYASGDHYRGDFRNGMRHGYGKPRTQILPILFTHILSFIHTHITHMYGVVVVGLNRFFCPHRTTTCE